MSKPPQGEAAPLDGRLPTSAVAASRGRALRAYVHVPFCVRRCGYCDFNTYTAAQLGGGASQDSYARTVVTEMQLARRVLDEAAAVRPVASVFFGGGTPTLLPASDLALLLNTIRDHFGLTPDAEVTVEANPDTVSQRYLAELAAAGVTRISVGMQSAVPHVLKTLDRTHNPDQVPQVINWARAAGLQTSLDLIYGTPGESLSDWRTSVQAAIDCTPDHVSAYALVIEPGTAMHQRLRHGQLPAVDTDAQADMYEAADDMLSAAGFCWYEISNWSTSPDTVCRHNIGYWQGEDWWGFGPGAHSHISGVRWWNLRHPRDYAARLAAAQSPAQAREVLDSQQQYMETVMLHTRLATGIPLAQLRPEAITRIPALVDQGFLRLLNGDGQFYDVLPGDSWSDDESSDERWPSDGGTRAVLTLRGRLLADAVIRDLLE